MSLPKIGIITTDKDLLAKLSTLIKTAGCQAVVVGDKPDAMVRSLYESQLEGLIVDETIPNFPPNAALDLINLMSLKIPLVVLSRQESHTERVALGFSDTVTIVDRSGLQEATVTIVSSTPRANAGMPAAVLKTIPYFNPHMAAKMLRDNDGLCILTIDTTSFRKVEVEYGTDVYNRLKAGFQMILADLWGSPGCFRSSDIVCRRSMHGNTYLVFLNRSRDMGALPRPGVLESIADRVNRRVLNALWSEVLHNSKPRIPDCVRHLPSIAVGYASAMHNPCLDVNETVSQLIDSGLQSAQVQLGRVHNHKRELMQTLIHGENLLRPHFQAIFHLGGITEEKVKQVKAGDSIAPILPDLFGFESLIRVHVPNVEGMIRNDDSIVQPKFLRPDILFAIAKSAKVALELDQACIKHAAIHSVTLPGKILVNILPRNLYFFEQLKHHFEGRENVIFEISESEAISNFELMLEVRQRIADQGFGIAADDFGKGFAGLERVINLKPDIIKFDRSLIEDIDKTPIKQAYLQGMVQAAKLLGATVLAEGVERWEEAKVLKEMGIDLVQGFLLHRPQALEAITVQLEEAKQTTATANLSGAA